MECRGLGVWILVLFLCSVTTAHYLRDSKNETISVQGTCFYNGTWFQEKEELPTRGLCLICHCFPGFAEPNAFTCSVIDCPWEDYHRRFPGCTPIYADRDCCPIGWECDYGTQNPGQQLSKDANCDCEWRYLKHYEAKGCRPVYEEKPKSEKPSCTCPWRFDCSQADEIHADERVCLYKKHVYPIGSKIPTSNPCESCTCATDYFTQAASISCTTTECPAVYSQTPLPEGCHYVYKEDQCCPTSVECPTGQKDNIYQVPACEYQGKMYYEGEQIYPNEDPCLICLCNQNWTGINSSSCRQHDCMLERDARKLKQGCIPIYHEKTCCPIDYHCADDDFDFKSNRGASFKSDDDEDEMCFFESRYYPIGHVLDIKHPTNCVTCTCKTPPDFTCIHSSCPPPPNNDYTNCRAVYKPHSCCPDYTCEEKTSTSCPDPICKGTNCWLVKQENGCQICRCKSRCVPCPPMCQPENPNNECSGCICQINSTTIFDFENTKKDELNEEQEKDSLQQLIQECKKTECSSDERCMLVEKKCDNKPCLPVPKCEKVAFGCGQSSCPEGCQEIGSYENNCPLCYCKDSIKEPQYKLTCRVQSCEENCVLTGRDESGCPICKCPQGNLEERACASSPCNGFNCTMSVNSLGCAECRCQLACKPKECPAGCDLDLDVSENSGLECGCQCKNSTTAMGCINSKPTPESCSPVSCRGLNCTVFEDKSGCPGCLCKAECPVPVCQEGCKIETEVSQPGRCPGCVCKLSRSARDNTGKDCPPPTCLGYNCSVITAENGCQMCLCESPCEEAPQCPSHCKLETNVPEGRCRGCVCSYGEHADADNKPQRGGGKIPDGADSEIEPEKREDPEADFIPLPGKELVPGVDNIFLIHDDEGQDQHEGMPGYHYDSGHAYPVFGEPLESGLYNIDDHIPGEFESSLTDEAREELMDEGVSEDRHAAEDYGHDEDGNVYVSEYAEEKAIDDGEDEKCAQKNCPEGQKCVIRRLQCIRTPCPTIPVCIDVEPRCPIPMCAIGCMVMKWDDEVCPSCFCGIIRGAEGRVCPRTRCMGRRCYNVIGDDGCPQCKCDSICIPPKCYDGCFVEKDPPAGKCPSCTCPDRSSVDKPIISGTSPAQNASGSNVEPGNESENVEDSKEVSEDNEKPVTESEDTDDTQGRNPITPEEETPAESQARPEIIDRNELLSGDFSADFYNTLAEIEHDIKSNELTTVTVDLPTTIDAADIFDSLTTVVVPSDFDSEVGKFTVNTDAEVSEYFTSASESRHPTTPSSYMLSEEVPTTKKPCVLKPNAVDEEEKEKPFEISEIISDVPKPYESESPLSYAPTTNNIPTSIPSRKPIRRPSPVGIKPTPSTSNKNSNDRLKPSRVKPKPQVASAAHGHPLSSASTGSKRPSTSSPNRYKPVPQPQIIDSYNEEIDQDENMKPILQNLQQLMSNLHHVLSGQQRPDVFEGLQMSVNTPENPKDDPSPIVVKVIDQSNGSTLDDLKQSETQTQDKIFFAQNNGPFEASKSGESNSTNIYVPQEEKIPHQVQNIHELASDHLNTNDNGTQGEAQSNLNSQSDLTFQNVALPPQQQYFLNPNVVPSNQQVMPSVLQQGVNTQFHMFPQFPYQNNPSNLQAMGIMQPQVPYQSPLQTIYTANGQGSLFNTQQQNPYYPSLQQPPFITNVNPFQSEQYGQSPSQLHKQHVLLTNIPIPPSLQQQLNAGTQTLGFLQQLINNRNNPFYQQQLLQSQMQHQQNAYSPTEFKPAVQEGNIQEHNSTNTNVMSNQPEVSDNQQTQETHQQYIYSNNQPLSSQQQFENGEVGSQHLHPFSTVGGQTIVQHNLPASSESQQHFMDMSRNPSVQYSEQPKTNSSSEVMPPFPSTSPSQSESNLHQFNHHAPQFNPVNQINNINLQQQQHLDKLAQQYQQLQEQINKVQFSHQQYISSQNNISKPSGEEFGMASPNSQVQEQMQNLNANLNPQQQQVYQIQDNNKPLLQQEQSHQQNHVLESNPNLSLQNVQQPYINNHHVPQTQEFISQYKPLQDEQQLSNSYNGQTTQQQQSSLGTPMNNPSITSQQTLYKPINQEIHPLQTASEEKYSVYNPHVSAYQQQVNSDNINATSLSITEQQQSIQPHVIYNTNPSSQQQYINVQEPAVHHAPTVENSPQIFASPTSTYIHQQQSQQAHQTMAENDSLTVDESINLPQQVQQHFGSSHERPLPPSQQIHEQTYSLNQNTTFHTQLNYNDSRVIPIVQTQTQQHVQQQYSTHTDKPLIQTYEVPQSPQIQNQQYMQQQQQFQQPYIQQQPYFNQHQQHIQHSYIPQHQPPTQQQNHHQPQFQQTYIQQQQPYMQQQQQSFQQQYIPQQPSIQNPQQITPQQQYIPQQNIPQQQYIPQQSIPQQHYVHQQQNIQQHYIPPQQQNIQQQANFQQQQNIQHQQNFQQQQNIHHQQHNIQQQYINANANPPSETQNQQHSMNSNEKPITQTQDFQQPQFPSGQTTKPLQSLESTQQHYIISQGYADNGSTEQDKSVQQLNIGTDEKRPMVQSNQQQYISSNNEHTNQEQGFVNDEHFNLQIGPSQQQLHHQGSSGYVSPQHVEDQIIIEPQFAHQEINAEQTHIEFSSSETGNSHQIQQSHAQTFNTNDSSLTQQDKIQHHVEDKYSALKPLAQITTADKQPDQLSSLESVSILGPNEAAPIQQVLHDLKLKSNQSDQTILQQSYLPNSYGVKTRPGAIVRPHFSPFGIQTSLSPPTSNHDLFPAPSRPINNKPSIQQQDWEDQEFMEDDPQELEAFDYDDFELAETTTYDPLSPGRHSITPSEFQPTRIPAVHLSDSQSTSPETLQHQILENFDNHQPDSAKKPLDQQELVDEYDTTTPKTYVSANTSPAHRPSKFPFTANPSNIFASFPTASPTAEAYGLKRHSTKMPSPLPSYQCPTPHCNGYNCSLIRGSDGCQKCVCDSPCAPCPQHCVKTKTLSEGRCPICDCTGAPSLALAAPTPQCPVVNCRGTNCRKVKDNKGCLTCICDPKCVEPQCDPGCEILRDVPPGQCPGCVCRVTVVQAVVQQKQRQCSPVKCGKNCKETRGPDSCPLCVCNPECPPPKCDVGCQVQTDVAAGQCPTCVCPNYAADDDDDEDDDLYCPNLFCSEYGCREIPGPAGCPICMCDPVCKTPVCDPGCQVVSNKYHGRCPVCICRNPINGTSSEAPFKITPSIEIVKTIPVQQQIQQQQQIQLQEQVQQPFTFSGLVEAVEAEEEDSTLSTLHTTVTVELDTEETTTELTTEQPTTTCPPPVCSGLRCNKEMGDNGCEICKCRYKCPKPKCVGHCYAETNAPSHRCPGCVCPQRTKAPKY